VKDSLPSKKAAKNVNKIRYAFWNCDCVEGMKRLPDECVDLIVADPPYGIGNPKSSYNRDDSLVWGGYVEAPTDAQGYLEFSRQWVQEAARLLKPGGSVYVFSGWTFGHLVKTALHETVLTEVNEIIWKYQFGVCTKRKFVSSHYHIYFWTKKGATRIFHTECRHKFGENDERGSLLYRDLEDVWVIKRPYNRGQEKNQNQLPEDVIEKILQYSSSPGDLVLDPFLGGFTTAKVAKRMDRRCIGFEINPKSFQEMVQQL